MERCGYPVWSLSHSSGDFAFGVLVLREQTADNLYATIAFAGFQIRALLSISQLAR